MTQTVVRRLDQACAVALVAYVIWVSVAFPWLEDVGCLRAGALSLRRLTIVAELGIFVPYTWMPVSLLLTWRAARARPGAAILVLYGAFIVLCGMTHLIGALGIPWADYAVSDPPAPIRLYWIAMKLKTVTGAVSFAVARMTDKKRHELLELSDQRADLVRQRDEAEAARSRARKQARRAKRQTALAEARAIELEAARAGEAQQTAEATRQAEEAQRARAEAEAQRAEAQKQAEDAIAARFELAQANEELERRRAAESERARAQASRAQTAEAENAEYQRLLTEIRNRDAHIAAQGEALRTLHTPILQALDNAIVTVLVGALNSGQVSDWTQRLLDEVSVKKSRFTIFDLSSLLEVDTAVADAIIKASRAVKLLGSHCILTGMRPQVAQTIVQQGIDLSDFVALPTLREAIASAMKRGATA